MNFWIIWEGRDNVEGLCEMVLWSKPGHMALRSLQGTPICRLMSIYKKKLKIWSYETKKESFLNVR